MNRKVILADGALLLAGCDARTVGVDVDPTKASYSRDARTNLCFAAFGRAEPGIGDVAKSFSVTMVPCSTDVLALVPRPQGGQRP